MHSNRIIQKVKDDYECIANEFSESRRFPWDEFSIFANYYNPKSTVIDLGCGNGRLLQFLNKIGYKSYLGIDFSSGLIEHARKLFPKNKFSVGDFSNFSSKKKFDAIFLIASFHHIPPKKQLETILKIKKILNKGGFIFMINWNLHQPFFFKYFLKSIFNLKFGFRGLLIPWKKKIYRYYYAFTKRRLSKLIKRSGLKIIENDYFNGDKRTNILRAKNILTIAKYE